MKMKYNNQISWLQHLVLLAFILSIIGSCSVVKNRCKNHIINNLPSYEVGSPNHLSFLYPAIFRENQVEGYIEYAISIHDSLQIEIIHSTLFYNSEPIVNGNKEHIESIFIYKMHQYLSSKNIACSCRLKCVYKHKESVVDFSKFKADVDILTEPFPTIEKIN